MNNNPTGINQYTKGGRGKRSRPAKLHGTAAKRNDPYRDLTSQQFKALRNKLLGR